MIDKKWESERLKIGRSDKHVECINIWNIESYNELEVDPQDISWLIDVLTQIQEMLNNEKEGTILDDERVWNSERLDVAFSAWRGDQIKMWNLKFCNETEVDLEDIPLLIDVLTEIEEMLKKVA